MKIRRVEANNRRRAFVLRVGGGRELSLPYSRLPNPPTPEDRLVRVFVDPELAKEAFTYVLESGAEESVPVDAVLEYNQDPDFLHRALLYRLTLEAERRVATARISRREMIRRLGTSPAQFYRLLDPRNTRKSLGQLIGLLHLLDCEVELVVRDRAA